MAGRNAALRGTNIELTALFYNQSGELADPSDLKVSVYPVGFNPESEDVTSDNAWVYQATLTSGGTGTLASESRVVEKTGTGQYSYTLPIPANASYGAAYDRWQGEVDLEDLDETFSFTIVAGGSVGTTVLYENNILYLTLKDTIASTDGSTLEEDSEYYFTTTYNPLYSSIRRLLLDMGPLVKDLSEDTMYLAIFEASLMADAFNFSSGSSNVSLWNTAKREFTTCLAERILANALLGDETISSKMYKSLGDLSVSRGGNLEGLRDFLNGAESCIEHWRRSLESGGNLSPYTSVKPNYSVKGATAVDAMFVHRQWQPTSRVGISSRPAANTSRGIWGRRSRKTYRTRND